MEAQQRWDSNPCQLTVNFLISDALDHCANESPLLSESFLEMKLQIRTIDLEKYMHEHILSPGEGSNMVNVVILLAFKALLMDFPDN